MQQLRKLKALRALSDQHDGNSVMIMLLGVVMMLVLWLILESIKVEVHETLACLADANIA